MSSYYTEMQEQFGNLRRLAGRVFYNIGKQSISAKMLFWRRIICKSNPVWTPDNTFSDDLPMLSPILFVGHAWLLLNLLSIVDMKVACM